MFFKIIKNKSKNKKERKSAKLSYSILLGCNGLKIHFHEKKVASLSGEFEEGLYGMKITKKLQVTIKYTYWPPQILEFRL